MACPSKQPNTGKKIPTPWKVKEENGASNTKVALLTIRSDFSSPSELSSPGEGAISRTINGQASNNMKKDSGASVSFVDSALLDPHYVRGKTV